MTHKQLNNLGRYWQKRLGLADWDTTFQFVRQYYLDPQNQAECSWNFASKEADIAILAPCDYSPRSARPQDIEKSLVHELMHLVLLPLVADTPKQKCQELEQTIEMLCRAFLEDRQWRPKSPKKSR